jgi:hypothetical protein
MPKLTPENVAEIIAERVGQAFSCSQFISLFEDQTLPSGWTLGDALAVWYSLGNLALVVSLSEAFSDEAKISRTTRLCQMLLPKQWGMSNEICAKFRVVIEKTEAAAFASFNACNNATELLVFFSRYVSRMLGTSLPFSQHSTFEDEPSDVRYQITDSILAASVCGLFIKFCTATKEFLDQAPIDWSSPKAIEVKRG